LVFHSSTICTNVGDETRKTVMDPASHYCPLHQSSFIFIRTLGGHSKTTECLVTLLLTCTTYFHIKKTLHFVHRLWEWTEYISQNIIHQLVCVLEIQCFVLS